MAGAAPDRMSLVETYFNKELKSAQPILNYHLKQFLPAKSDKKTLSWVEKLPNLGTLNTPLLQKDGGGKKNFHKLTLIPFN